MTTTIGQAPVCTPGKIDIVDGGKKRKVGFLDISKIESLNDIIPKSGSKANSIESSRKCDSSKRKVLDLVEYYKSSDYNRADLSYLDCLFNAIERDRSTNRDEEIRYVKRSRKHDHRLRRDREWTIGMFEVLKHFASKYRKRKKIPWEILEQKNCPLLRGITHRQMSEKWLHERYYRRRYKRVLVKSGLLASV